jgi:hypothetical protein
MGGLRTGEQTQTLPGRKSAEPEAGDDNRAGHRRRGAVVAAYLLSGAVLFAAYARLSQTYTLNSDSANILLMGSDLLHGNLLLHGWYMSDVSFYPTELPQYALLESFLGLRAETAHIAAGMTYTLALLFAVMLARSGSSGRQRLIRTLIAAGIMLAPQLGLGVFAMDLSVGHIGTAVPLLLIWLLLDRTGRSAPRWYVPVLVAVLLAWVQVADPIVYVVGIGPLGIVCAARVIRGWIRASGSWWRRTTAQWYDLSLGAASVAAAGLAWIANNVLSALGGYTVNRLPFYLTPWPYLRYNWPAGWKVLEVFGANYTGLSGIPLVLAFLHLAGVALVALAMARVAWRFFGVSLVDQILAIAIVLNVVLYLLTNASDEAAHEVAIIAPFGAALAARVLVRTRDPVPAGDGILASGGRSAGRRARRVRSARLVRLARWAQTPGRVLAAGWVRLARWAQTPGRVLAAGWARLVRWVRVPGRVLAAGWMRPARLVRAARRIVVAGLVRLARWTRLPRLVRLARRVWLSRRVRLAGFAAGILVLIGYAAGLAWEITQPALPAANTSLATWLLDHHLTYGLSGYWTSSSVTLDSGNKVQVRALAQHTMRRDLWMANETWYDPRTHYANFIVLDSTPGYFSHWEPLKLIDKYFGIPARIYETGPYTVLVWNKNLLLSIPGNPVVPATSGPVG